MEKRIARRETEREQRNNSGGDGKEEGVGGSGKGLMWEAGEMA